ncbi:hypothetical protein [Salinivibrio proteolyticus]|uniref:Uncharacterized protein n=1 Tax=Salinivibrio proteolyticus TaxID=334715 RepID=A0ABY7LKV4_9GAMM|nr:hypothetical protein [Salinivibrio proteolyticus]WBA16555.1 hypothetical protein N7E60_14310 [Salinivibrio proteolyticus]
MSKTNTSDEIVRNAVELQGLQMLQVASDSLRDDRLSNIMLKNQVMMKWLQEPDNKDYPQLLAQIGAKSFKEEVKQAYTYALDLVRQKDCLSETDADTAEKSGDESGSS